MTINQEFGHGRNVRMILIEGYRTIYGSIPREVRSELSLAVKTGVLGRIPKGKLTHEVYYNPAHKSSAQWSVQDELAQANSIISRMFTIKPEERDVYVRSFA